MKTKHNLLLLAILALLGCLWIFRPIEGFEDISSPTMNSLKRPPPNTYDPVAFAKGAAAGGGQTEFRMLGGVITRENSFNNPSTAMLSNLKQICTQLPELEVYLQNMPTQMAPTQMAPTQIAPTQMPPRKPTPATTQGVISQVKTQALINNKK